MSQDDLLAGIEDDAPAAIVVAKPTGMDAIREVEDRLLLRAIGQTEDSLCWADVDIGTAEPPQEWVDELGQKGAMRRLRVVQAAQMSAKESPVGLKHSKEILVSVIKARATEKAAPKHLNIQIGHMDFALPNYPTIKVER